MPNFKLEVLKISFFVFLTLFVFANRVIAADSRVLGIHILRPEEISQAKSLLLEENQEEWKYITIPLSLEDLNRKDNWQEFFWKAKEAKFIPIVRLVTRFDNESWQLPNKKEITNQISFLSSLEWPTPERHIIVLNEVNHAPEFGGQIDPSRYAKILEFTSNWAHSEAKNYKVLPAAMDLAASNTSQTMEAFLYLEKMYAANPEVFDTLDYWNSHSYPNPGFVSSPTRHDKKSLRGFEHELAFVKDKTGKDLQVFITETGWRDTSATSRWLDSYYEYAMQHIWSDPRIKAVTPFILQGSPGPFAAFSFLDEAGQPNRQYYAYRNLIEKY
ncbi:MAG: hypothetical protein ABFQ62_00730 [Patescibacteria group bacterium]